MKKLIAALCFFLLPTFGQADELDSSYTINTLAHYENLSVLTSTIVIAVDASDTVNYPRANAQTGYIALSKIKTAFKAVGLSSGTIQYGVVTFVNESTGTVKWFSDMPFITGLSSETVRSDELLAPLYVRARVKPDGTTPYIVSSTSTLGSPEFQNDVALPTSIGTFTTPAVGDILLKINIQGGSLRDLVSDLFFIGQKP